MDTNFSVNWNTDNRSFIRCCEGIIVWSWHGDKFYASNKRLMYFWYLQHDLHNEILMINLFSEQVSISQWYSKLTCKLKVIYTITDPVVMVPTAKNRPSFRTANSDKHSSYLTCLHRAPFSGFHNCIRACSFPFLRSGEFVIVTRQLLFGSLSRTEYLQIEHNLFRTV